ncbi:hypothetical protein PMAYCL1PPCAC_04340, partial [Pristionchus mayeri]
LLDMVHELLRHLDVVNTPLQWYRIRVSSARMSYWEDRKSKEAKRGKIYAEMRDSMATIKEHIENEEILESYMALLIRFIHGRSSLIEMDKFASESLPAEVRSAHDKLFTHLLDGAQVPIGKKAEKEEAGKKREYSMPTESFITLYLFLMGARHGLQEVHPDSGQIIKEALTFHVKGIIEDAVKLILPYLVTPAGMVRLNTATDPIEQRRRHKITKRDVRDGIDMADGTALWVQFNDPEMKEKLRRKFEERQEN